MHLHKLIYQFKVLVECKTFTAASESLCISQPTLTQNIKRLEQALGTSLLVRTTKGITKTLYGDSLYKHACLLDKNYQQALNEIESIKSQQRQSLIVECGYAWSHGQLVTLLQGYIEQHPNLKIIIKNSNTDDCQDRLIKGKCDIALGAIPAVESQEKDINYIPIFETQFSLFCSPSHPLTQHKNITIKQLEKADWIVLKHDGEDKHHQDPYLFPFKENSVRFEVHSVTSALALLSGSQCLMALPQQLCHEALRKGLVELKSNFEFPIYITGIMYTDEALLQAHKKEMINSILSWKEQLLSAT